MNDPFARFAALVARFRWIVLLIWLVVLPVAGSQGAAKAATFSTQPAEATGPGK